MESGRKSLIINADAIGYSTEHDEAIFELLSQGYVTATSLLVTSNYAEKAFARARSLAIPFGLQLNLVEGKPLSPVEKISSLLNRDGELRGQLQFMDALAAGEIQAEHLRVEIKAQLEWVTSRGGTITHLCGHLHCHVRAAVVDVLIPLMIEHGVRHVRIPEESNTELATIVDTNYRHTLVLVSRDAVKARPKFTAAGILSPCRFEGNSLMGWSSTLERTKSIFSHMAAGEVMEWMTNPGYPSKNGSQFYRSAERKNELENLRNPKLHEWFKENNIHLIGWKDLTPELLSRARGPEGAVGAKADPETESDPHRNAMKGHRANRVADLAAMREEINPITSRVKAAFVAVEEGALELYHGMLAGPADKEDDEKEKKVATPSHKRSRLSEPKS